MIISLAWRVVKRMFISVIGKSIASMTRDMFDDFLSGFQARNEIHDHVSAPVGEGEGDGLPMPEFAPVTSASWPLRTLLIGQYGITASGKFSSRRCCCINSSCSADMGI